MSEKRIESPSSYSGSLPIKIILPVEVKKEEEEETDAEINSGKA